MRNTIKDANLADKLSAEDKEKIEKAVDKVVEWLDHNQVGCISRGKVPFHKASGSMTTAARCGLVTGCLPH